MARIWKVVGINFDFRHMDHLLAFAHEAPNAEIVGVCHSEPEEMEAVIRSCALSAHQVFTDWEECLERTDPDVVFLCPSIATHAEWVLRMAENRRHVLLEKPFAATLAEADAMTAAMKEAGRQLAVNWPLAWYPPHRTAHRLLNEGRLGELEEVHFYDGNRGSIIDRSKDYQPLPTLEEKQRHWYYQENSGGSLLDYLGYGATLATWYFGGRKPSEIMSLTGGDPRVPVDEQSVTIARYGDWLSTFQTRWGTFSDPWVHQPQPKCGFVLKGSRGTLSHYDYEDTVRLQDKDHPAGVTIPVDASRYPHQNPVQSFLHCLETGEQVEGPISVETSRIGQQIMETARESARRKTALPLID